MVKCADCGFLAVRNIQTRELEEADDTLRTRGDRAVVGVAPQLGGAIYRVHFLPLCFIRKSDLRREIKDFERKDEPRELYSVFFVVDEDRECDGFIQWQQGFTPKEHLEMLNQERLLRWQAEREDADMAFRTEQAEEDRKWRSDERRRNIIGLIIAVAAIAVASVISLVAAIIQRDAQPTIIVQNQMPSLSAPTNTQP